jgi:hypothetical protein
MPVTPAAVASHQNDPTPEPMNTPTDPALEGIAPFQWPDKFDAATFEGATKSATDEATAFNSRLAMIREEMEKVFSAEMANFKASLGGESMPDEFRQKFLQTAIERATKVAHQKRDAQLKEYAGFLDHIAQQLEAKERQLAGMLQVMPNPPAMLEVESVRTGMESRLKWEGTLGSASYATLKTLCAFAMSTGNLALAGALCAKLHAVAKNNRPISAFALAEHFVGEQHKRLKLAHAEVSDLRKSALTQKSELLSGKATLTSRIAAGLRQQAIKSQRSALGDDE